MSFILDALRKSEAERQRQTGPGLADAGYRPPARRRAVWLPLLVIVLAANVLVLSWALLRERPAAAPPATAPTGEAPPAPTISPGATTPAPADAPAGAPAEADGEDGDWATTADLPAVVAEPLAAAPPEPPDAVASAPAAPATSVVDAVPTMAQLEAAGALSLPPLHLDIHVFNDRPAERFVFVNMRRYGEGAQLSEGPRVAEITPEGVILDHGGQRFLLPRN
jgi:general secretion pathway protein B